MTLQTSTKPVTTTSSKNSNTKKTSKQQPTVTTTLSKIGNTKKTSKPTTNTVTKSLTMKANTTINANTKINNATATKNKRIICKTSSSTNPNNSGKACVHRRMSPKSSQKGGGGCGPLGNQGSSSLLLPFVGQQQEGTRPTPNMPSSTPTNAPTVVQPYNPQQIFPFTSTPPPFLIPTISSKD